MNFQGQIVTQARTWLGTPFHHQGRLKEVGCDCLGLFIGIAKELDVYSPDDDRKLADLDIINYSATPNTERLIRELEQNLEQISPDDLKPGTLALFNVINSPQHLGIITDYAGGELGLLHSISGRGVVEHHLNQDWRSRICRAYRLTEKNFRD
jgi:cell wall-associated NlpC family hydrolase